MDTSVMKVDEVLDEVRGHDQKDEAPTEGWEERAKEALHSEEAREKPRKSLVEQLRAILGLAVPGDDDVDEDADTVWLEYNGQAWHVEVGSAAHERMIAEGARTTDPPAGA